MSFVCEKICIQFVYDGEKKMFVVWLRMCGYYTSTILFVLAHGKKKEVETKKSQPQKAMELFEINKTKHYISVDEMKTFYFEIGMVSRSPLSLSLSE